MTFDWGTLALQVVNFLVLAFLLQRFLYRPVLRIIDRRRAEIDAWRNAASEAEEEAEERLEEVTAEREHIADERAAALEAAADTARVAAEERRRSAEVEAEEIVASAHRRLAAEREAALREARSVALDLGGRTARRLLAEIPADTLAEAWLERVERYMADLSAQDRRELVRGLDEAEIRVVTAQPVPERARKAWRERLPAALGIEGAAIDFREDPALVAGVEVQLPYTLVRLSWRSILEGTAEGETAP